MRDQQFTLMNQIMQIFFQFYTTMPPYIFPHSLQNHLSGSSRSSIFKQSAWNHESHPSQPSTLSSHSLLHTPHGYLGPVFLFFLSFFTSLSRSPSLCYYRWANIWNLGLNCRNQTTSTGNRFYTLCFKRCKIYM
jgi:hypothetical protein